MQEVWIPMCPHFNRSDTIIIDEISFPILMMPIFLFLKEVPKGIDFLARTVATTRGWLGYKAINHITHETIPNPPRQVHQKIPTTIVLYPPMLVGSMTQQLSINNLIAGGPWLRPGSPKLVSSAGRIFPTNPPPLTISGKSPKVSALKPSLLRTRHSKGKWDPKPLSSHLNSQLKRSPNKRESQKGGRLYLFELMCTWVATCQPWHPLANLPNPTRKALLIKTVLRLSLDHVWLSWVHRAGGLQATLQPSSIRSTSLHHLQRTIEDQATLQPSSMSNTRLKFLHLSKESPLQCWAGIKVELGYRGWVWGYQIPNP